MDWANERWIRLYTRDTGDWLMWPWQTRALFLFILRKVDRAGMMQLGKGKLQALAAMVGMPSQDVTEWIEPLLEDGCVKIHNGVLCVPNFIPAQETVQTDRARQQASRERARSRVLSANDGHGASHAVTDGHVESPLDKTRQERQDERGSDARAQGEPSEETGVSERRLKSVHPPPPDPEPSEAATPGDGGTPVSPPGRVTGRERSPQLADPDGQQQRRQSAGPCDHGAVASGGSESGYDLARRLWSEAWQAKYRRPYDFSPRMGPGSEDYVLQRVAESASIRVGPGAAETYLRHKFAAYLRDHGTRGYLDEERHPLRCLERDWAKYGEPKEPKRMVPRREEPVELVSVEEMAARAAAAMTMPVAAEKKASGER